MSVPIYDVFVLSKNGLPFTARCYNKEKCMKEENHVLVGGFLSAVNSFSLEFTDEPLQTMEYKHSTLVIYQEMDLIVAILFEDEEKEIMRLFANEILAHFEANYKDIIKKNIFSTEMLTPFNYWIDSIISKEENTIKNKNVYDLLGNWDFNFDENVIMK